MSEFTVAKILKQLALILEENGFVIYYDKRFPSMKPHINDTTPLSLSQFIRSHASALSTVQIP